MRLRTLLISLNLILLGGSQNYDIFFNNRPDLALSSLQINKEVHNLLNDPVNYFKNVVSSKMQKPVHAKDESAICEEKILSLLKNLKTSKESLSCKNLFS